MLYIHALSPVHVGIGQASGVIDLPVIREKHTGYPYLPGSGIKGVLRDAARPPEGNDAALKLFHKAFGPETTNASDNSGALQFTDARLLALAVRSYHGTFAWVSCREALMRWVRDYSSAGFKNAPTVPSAPAFGGIHVMSTSKLKTPASKVVLEEFDLTVEPAQLAVSTIAGSIAKAVFADIAWQTRFEERFAIVSDDLFSNLCVLATDVVARIKIDGDTKTVAHGQLWFEESVPMESIFASAVMVDPATKGNPTDYLDFVKNATTTVLQIGGKASVGRGLVRVSLQEGDVDVQT